MAICPRQGRRLMCKFGRVVIGVAAVLWSSAAVMSAQADSFSAGVAAGDVTHTSAILWSRAELPGNIRLPKGEGGLPRPSVINVTQIATIDRADIDSVAGRLSRRRLAEVWDGIRLVIEPS